MTDDVHREFISLNLAVLVVSDSRTETTDKSGKLLEQRLQDAGHRLYEKQIVPDDIHRQGWYARGGKGAV